MKVTGASNLSVIRPRFASCEMSRCCPWFWDGVEGTFFRYGILNVESLVGRLLAFQFGRQEIILPRYARIGCKSRCVRKIPDPLMS